eukprot:GHVH01016422.1.p1 GENE.GHVH01016422.1~~GHVH01016422.1.p1  ORF type:complete len:237 (+),score=24.12 GHVH01016422.1:33-743(+)
MAVSRVLVVGASRGIGLGIVKKLLSKGHHVHATVRSGIPVENLPGNLTWHQDVECTSSDKLRLLSQKFESKSLDVIYYVSGVYPQCGDFPKADECTDSGDFFTAMEQGFKVNTLAPLKAFSILSPLLKDGGKFPFLTTKMGSLSDNTSGGHYAYRVGKVALNMAVVSLVQEPDVKQRQLILPLIHPGWIQTDMTGSTGNHSIEQCVDALVPTVENATLEDSGRFIEIMREGKTLAW